MSDGPLKDELRALEQALETLDGPALPLAADDTLDSHTRSELRKLERQIALKYHGGTMWPYAAITIARAVNRTPATFAHQGAAAISRNPAT